MITRQQLPVKAARIASGASAFALRGIKEKGIGDAREILRAGEIIGVTQGDGFDHRAAAVLFNRRDAGWAFAAMQLHKVKGKDGGGAGEGVIIGVNKERDSFDFPRKGPGNDGGLLWGEGARRGGEKDKAGVVGTKEGGGGLLGRESADFDFRWHDGVC